VLADLCILVNVTNSNFPFIHVQYRKTAILIDHDVCDSSTRMSFGDCGGCLEFGGSIGAISLQNRPHSLHSSCDIHYWCSRGASSTTRSIDD